MTAPAAAPIRSGPEPPGPEGTASPGPASPGPAGPAGPGPVPAADPAPEWHRWSADAVADRLGTGTSGLSQAEASARLARYGRNELVDRGATSPWRLLWEQFTAVMVLLLIGAAVLSLALGKLLEAGSIGAIVVLFGLLGFLQEYRAERAIAALRRLSVPSVRTVRDGTVRDLPAVELVPGDVVVLEAGNVVPADVRLVEAAGLRVQEAALTGESEPVDKHTAALASDDLALGDRSNLAYSGTHVTLGRGRGIVVATGMETELGRIASLLQGVGRSATPLQERLDRVGKQLALAGLVVALVVMGLGWLGGEPLSELVLTAISVAVAVIPEGLPAVVTFTLAIGAQRMLRRNALVRKLPAVETLGSVTVICSDKTGTLTQNRMAVVGVEMAGAAYRPTGSAAHAGTAPEVPASHPVVAATLAAAALCNDGEVEPDGVGGLNTLGDPTETALLHAAHDAGIDVRSLRQARPRYDERPFNSDRKRMSTLHAAPLPGLDPPWALGALPTDQPLAFVKGAVDGFLPRITAVLTATGPEPLSPTWRNWLTSTNEAMASRGLRVLAVAYRTLPVGDPVGAPADPEDDLVLLGLVALIDPPRPEAGEAIGRCTTAGVRTVMITGDHPSTARAIAAELGIDTTGSVVTGAELDDLDDADLPAALDRANVFARVSPEHKLRLVRSLQDSGEVVAMTGDGVNDAPALKRADIGVAMDITGTDVSKEASDMVLRDDNFATIVAAVEEGRVIYDNLRRFVSFAVAGNIGKIAVMVLWPLPFLLSGNTAAAVALLPLQLLWLNLMTDGLLGLALGMEPAERNVMHRPPHHPEGSIWAAGLGRRTAVTGAVIGAITLAVGFAYHAGGSNKWQTMLFTTLALLQVGQALGSRSATGTRPFSGLFANKVLLAAVALVVALQLAAVFTPLRTPLDLMALGPLDLAVAVGAGALFLLGLEAVGRRGARQPAATTA